MITALVDDHQESFLQSSCFCDSSLSTLSASLPMSFGDCLADDTHELWLLRVPQHSVLRESLIGKFIVVNDAAAQNSVRGNYRFRDCALTPAAQRIRPLFASKDADGQVRNVFGTTCGDHSVCSHLENAPVFNVFSSMQRLIQRFLLLILSMRFLLRPLVSATSRCYFYWF